MGAQKPIQNPGRHPWGKFQCFSAGSFWDVWNTSHSKKVDCKISTKNQPSFEHFHVNFQGIYIYIYIHGHDDRGGGTTNKNTLQAFGFRWPQGKADLHDKDGEDQPISTRLQLGGTRKLSQLGRQNFPKDSTQILVMG